MTTLTKEQLHQQFLTEDWPKFIELFPGSPNFEGDGPFEQRATEMVAKALAAGCSITGSPLTDEQLALAERRPVKDFLNHLRTLYNRNALISEWRVTRDLLAVDQAAE